MLNGKAPVKSNPAVFPRPWWQWTWARWWGW